MVRAFVTLAAVSALTAAGIIAIHVNQQTEREVLSAVWCRVLHTSKGDLVLLHRTCIKESCEIGSCMLPS